MIINFYQGHQSLTIRDVFFIIHCPLVHKFSLHTPIYFISFREKIRDICHCPVLNENLLYIYLSFYKWILFRSCSIFYWHYIFFVLMIIILIRISVVEILKFWKSLVLVKRFYSAIINNWCLPPLSLHCRCVIVTSFSIDGPSEITFTTFPQNKAVYDVAVLFH